MEKARFPYKHVDSQDYGCTVEDILAMTDKELNQVVSLKKLAPYADEDPRLVRRAKKVKKRLDKLASYAANDDDGGGDDEREKRARRHRMTKKERRRRARGEDGKASPKEEKERKHSKKEKKRGRSDEDEQDRATKDRLAAFEVPKLKKKKEEPAVKLW